MKLNVSDRLAILSLLPRQGDVTTLRIIRDLERELSFSEEEHAELGFRREGELLMWDSSKDKVKEIAFGERARRVVYDVLESKSKAQTLGREFLGLYEMFVEPETALVAERE